jgi:ATP-grasp domain, R2K clade family 3
MSSKWHNKKLLLYPSSQLDPRAPDEIYAEEYAAAANLGLRVARFSLEDFLDGEFRCRPRLAEGDEVLYRGWMLTPEQYTRLESAVAEAGGKLVTSAAQYQRCHHLPGWYDALQEFTPETLFAADADELQRKLEAQAWDSCFLKDYVKSLGASEAMVRDLARLPATVAQMIEYRGQIEGGLCARRIEDFDPESEERYFVFQGQAYARDGIVPELVNQIAQRIDCPFFSVDTIRRRDGVLRLVELGDGQVSDHKKWPVVELVKIFAGDDHE